MLKSFQSRQLTEFELILSSHIFIFNSIFQLKGQGMMVGQLVNLLYFDIVQNTSKIISQIVIKCVTSGTITFVHENVPGNLLSARSQQKHSFLFSSKIAFHSAVRGWNV